MSYQSEAQLEHQLIENLVAHGYERVVIPDMETLESNFRTILNLFNKGNLKGKDLSDKEFERVMLEINGKSVYQSAKQLRDKFTITRDDGTSIYLSLFDTKDYTKNIYQVTNQVTVKDKYTNRYDVTILINGLPVVQIELKRRGIDIKQAFNQIERYRKHSYHGLFRYVQMFIISNGVTTKYFANTDTKPLFAFTFYWTDLANNRINNLQDFSRAFLDKNHLAKMIAKYTIVNDTDKCIMVMRPYQVYATEAVVKTALETASGGYVWHTTGSGKTLTSFKCSQILSLENSIKKVIFVVDRSDLDTNTTTEFNKFEADSVDGTSNTYALVKQLGDDNRKFIVTTIQKLHNAVKTARYEKTLAKFKGEKVIIIFDECHRSTFGSQMTDIRRAFDKGQFFGFTGTPIFTENKAADGRTTADIFGKCLHTYLIKEAILDNNVLGFSVEYMKTISGKYDEEDVTKVYGIDTAEAFDSPERLELIANHIIAYHNLKTHNRQYSAIFATSSVENLIKYYDIFKKIDHNLNIAAIFTYGANEDCETKDEHSRDALERIIDDYNEMFGTKFHTDTFDAYNKDIQKKVKAGGYIDILIVVNMYLTGFDSKPLNTLYVDKNLEWHGLIQAYSRTNRVEQVTKPFGNVICYRNLKEKTDNALRLFSNGDHEVVLIKDYEFYLAQFKEKLTELYKIALSPADVDSLQREEDKKAFIIAFRELSKVLMVLETFIEFDFDFSIEGISHQEYEDFRSKYFDIYRELNTRATAEKASILQDIDFSIELMATDRINVSYIMNLIRNIDRNDKARQKRDIDHIKKEIARSDSIELRKKVDLIKKFLDEILPNVSAEDNIDDVYESYENAERNEEIKKFAEEHEISEAFLKEEIAEYEFSGIIRKQNIMDNVKLPFLKKTKVVKAIIDFINYIIEKYQ